MHNKLEWSLCWRLQNSIRVQLYIVGESEENLRNMTTTIASLSISVLCFGLSMLSTHASVIEPRLAHEVLAESYKDKSGADDHLLNILLEILNNVLPQNEMPEMIQFREKRERNRKHKPDGRIRFLKLSNWLIFSHWKIFRHRIYIWRLGQRDRNCNRKEGGVHQCHQIILQSLW